MCLFFFFTEESEISFVSWYWWLKELYWPYKTQALVHIYGALSISVLIALVVKKDTILFI